MATIQEYIRGLHPDLLKQILWDYCEASEEYDPTTILLVCETLCQHDRSLPDPREAFRHLCRQYLR